MPPSSLSLYKPSPRCLIERVVSEPQLAGAIQSLTPHTLGKLINHIGLEDSGELIALASTAQIEKILDEDLWRSDSPGCIERFDEERFVLWLQVMLEVGERFAAEKIEELSEDFVALALQRNILVVNSDELRNQINDDEENGEMTDKVIEGSLYEEIDEYMLIARRHDGWDAILSVLTSLDSMNRPLLRRLLERCCAVSQRFIDDEGGLYEVLASDESLESDLAGDREDRRSADGFIGSAVAASFLNISRVMDPASMAKEASDPIVKAHLKNLTRSVSVEKFLPTSQLERLIAEITVEPANQKASAQLLLGKGAATSKLSDGGLFRAALNKFSEQNPAAHSRYLDELTFVCNALMAGRPIMGRVFRPYEAIVATAAVCNLGLERVVLRDGKRLSLPAAISGLERHGVDGILRIGLSILHHEITAFTLEKISLAIERYNTDQEDPRLEKLIFGANEALRVNKPWQFGRKIHELHGIIDSSNIDVMKNLIEEFPLMTQGLAQNIDSPFRIDDAHHLISTGRDVGKVRKYVDDLLHERSLIQNRK
jgi:hypothetical protein